MSEKSQLDSFPKIVQPELLHFQVEQIRFQAHVVKNGSNSFHQHHLKVSSHQGCEVSVPKPGKKYMKTYHG